MSGLVLANVIGLVAALACLAALAFPPGRAMRVRNAFLLRRGSAGDFAWTPESVPKDFRLERGQPPEPIASAIAQLPAQDGDWARARALVAMLVEHWRREGHLRADLRTTWRGIRAGGGSCSDYVRVYLAAAAGLGLFCRQWAFSFDGFGAHGHTFVEVWDRRARRWVFLDVHNNVYAVAPRSEAPIDALALRDAVLAEPVAMEFRQAAPGRLGWPDLDKLVDYYRRGAGEWYLWWGNDVIERDAGGRWAHRLASAGGRLPELVALVTPDNEAAVERMERLRGFARSIAIAVIVLALALALQLGIRGAGRGHA